MNKTGLESKLLEAYNVNMGVNILSLIRLEKIYFWWTVLMIPTIILIVVIIVIISNIFQINIDHTFHKIPKYVGFTFLAIIFVTMWILSEKHKAVQSKTAHFEWMMIFIHGWMKSESKSLINEKTLMELAYYLATCILRAEVVLKLIPKHRHIRLSRVEFYLSRRRIRLETLFGYFKKLGISYSTEEIFIVAKTRLGFGQS